MNKKSIFILGILLLAGLVNQAQDEASSSKFYVKAYGGYGLFQPGSYKLYSSIIMPSGNVTGTVSQSTQGLGSGIRFGGGIGVIASDFLNIGVDVEYLSGSELKSSSTFTSSSGYHSLTDRTVNYNSLSITPHVIFKALSKPDYLIYNKLGILLNLPMDLNTTQYDSSYIGGKPEENYSSHVTGDYKIKLTAGLNVALGIQYRLTDNLRAYGEIFGNFIVLVPDTYDETNIATVGNNPPGTSINHVKYIQNGQTSSTSTIITNGISTSAVVSDEYSKFNMNTIGINIGIAYRF